MVEATSRSAPLPATPTVPTTARTEVNAVDGVPPPHKQNQLAVPDAIATCCMVTATYLARSVLLLPVCEKVKLVAEGTLEIVHVPMISAIFGPGAVEVIVICWLGKKPCAVKRLTVTTLDDRVTTPILPSG